MENDANCCRVSFGSEKCGNCTNGNTRVHFHEFNHDDDEFYSCNVEQQRWWYSISPQETSEFWMMSFVPLNFRLLFCLLFVENICQKLFSSSSHLLLAPSFFCCFLLCYFLIFLLLSFINENSNKVSNKIILLFESDSKQTAN